MKSSLERTSILSKDLMEQPERKYIVLVPELSMVLTADLILVTRNSVEVKADGECVAIFSPELSWMCLNRNSVDLCTREAQLRRVYESATAEMALEKELKPPGVEEKPDEEKKHLKDENRWGMYL